MTSSPTSPLTTTGDLFVSAGDKAVANAAFNALYGQPEEVDNFTVELSATGDGPATHYGSSGRFTDAQWIATRDAFVMAVPSFRFYARGVNLPTQPMANRLTESSSATAVPQLGEYWSWAQSCEDAGVTQVVIADPLGI